MEADNPIRSDPAMDTTEHQRSVTEDEEPSRMIAELPKAYATGNHEHRYWKGFWVEPPIIKSVMGIEAQFEPRPSDIILASYPKTGTTWLKALTVTTLNMHSGKQNSDHDPLLTQNPHELVPILEWQCFGDDPKFDIREMTSSPRVFNTHLPYSLLPQKIKDSGCQIIYISRNPMDTVVSSWRFLNHYKDATIEEALADFCKGVYIVGSYFDHVLEYWGACNERPGTLFLTYEGLKQEPIKHVKRLAEFLGRNLDLHEIEQVVEKCSYERLSNLPINKSTSEFLGRHFSTFFRKGTVGDSKNYLTPDMVEQLREVAMQKWEGSGLKFQSVDEILGLSG